MPSLPLIRYVLTGAMRDRLVVCLFALIAVGLSLSIFLGSAPVIEKGQFSVVFAAGGLRLAAVAGLVLFCVFFIRRSFDARDVDFILTRPVGRASFLLSHALAFSLIAVLLAAFVALAVFFSVPPALHAGFGLWTAGLAAELVIMVNAALFFAMVLSSPAAAGMAVFALYILSRLIGMILGIAVSGLSTSPALQVLAAAMEIISLIVPRLDLLAQSGWLIYGPGPEIGFGFILAQGLIYSGLLLTAALVDLARRQF